MTPEVEIEGVSETTSSLNALGDEVGKPPGGWGAVEQIVLMAARAGAPKRTGRLAASGQAGGNPEQAQATFTVPYANPIHWGWPARNIKPQPFLTNAVRTTEPVWAAAYERKLQDTIDKEQG